MILVPAVLAATVLLSIGVRCVPLPARIVAMTTWSGRASSTRSRRAFAITASTLGLLGVASVGGLFTAIACVVGEIMRRRVAAVRQARRRHRAIADHYPDFLDLLVLTFNAGCNPLQAFRSLVDAVDQPFDGAIVELVRRVDSGARFVEALSVLPDRLGPIARPLVDSLALAERYGVPLASTLDRLSLEAHNQRRRHADAAARKLPIKLSFPLVTCTLPSFVLLSIVPLMAGTFSSLRTLTR